MSKDVYANGMEVSAKAAGNKSVCAMADVCLTPPSPPAGPIPIPYPNTSSASDTSSGSKTVRIGGKETGLKNASKYKVSSGDEAATKSQGAGIVSHNIKGATKFAAWSMDVQFEGKNVTRHMDMTLHNHGSPSNIAMVLSAAKMNVEMLGEMTCEDLAAENENAKENHVKGGANGVTVTSAAYRPPGPAPADAPIPGEHNVIQMKAVTPGDRVRSGASSGYAPANQKRTMACKEEEWGGGSPRFSAVESNKARNHTEPKLIEQVFSANGGKGGDLGTLVMNIDHTSKDGVTDAMPCENCRKGVCAAVDCGLEIVLCDKKNEETEPPCKDGEPAPESEWKARGL